MIFFSDRDLGAEIFPDILADAGILIERHEDHFDDNARDDQWIPEVATRGWFILTHDRRIRYRTLELNAVMRSRAGLFVLIGSVPTRELAHNFVNSIDRITNFIRATPRPFIAKVYRPSPVKSVATGKPGRVDLWLSHDEWADT